MFDAKAKRETLIRAAENDRLAAYKDACINQFKPASYKQAWKPDLSDMAVNTFHVTRPVTKRPANFVLRAWQSVAERFQ